MITHGHSVGKPTRTLLTWYTMKRRCNDKTFVKYPIYGGRGIKVCERWQSFENFLSDMGEKPEGKTIERINNDGDYEPSNCRWATAKEQSNNKRSNRLLTLHGETKTLQQWADKLCIDQSGLFRRIARGWSIERALTQPKKGT